VLLAALVTVSAMVGLVVTSGTASADVDSVQGSAFGAFVGGALTILPPTPTVSLNANESSPPSAFGPFVQDAANVNLPGILSVPVLRAATQAGDIVGENHFGFVASLAEAAGVIVGVNAITADLIQSTCVSNGDGSTGSTTIVNGVLGGSPLLDVPIAPNTQVQIPGVLTATLNEQIRNDAPGSTSIIVRAAHIQLLPSPLLPTAVVDIIIAESRCAAQGPNVLIAPPATTTTTTAPPATTTTTTAPPATTTTTAPPATTTTTAPPATTTTAPPATTTTTAPPGTTTTAPPATTTTTAPPATTTTVVSPTVPPVQPTTTKPAPLVRTGSDARGLAMFALISLLLGSLLVMGGRGLPAQAGAASVRWPVAPPSKPAPQKWGPSEIGQALWCGMAAGIVSGVRLLRRARRPKG
jgi:hypothetical protein